MDTVPKHTTPHTTLYVSHLFILTVGFFIGIFASYLFMLIPFDFSSELRKARELGIVSISTLVDHPKTKDFVAYFSLLFFPFSFSVLPWYFWARRRMTQLSELFKCPEAHAPGGKYASTLLGLLAICACVILTFRISEFYMANYNPFVGSWPFLGEEGENLAWAQSILSGGLYGKDFFCSYGPLLVYPLAAAMKIFGQTVVIERVVKYCYDLLAFGIVVVFLFKTVRSYLLFVLGSLLFFSMYPPLWSLSINFSALRFVPEILSFFLINAYREKGGRRRLAIAGLVTGLGALFSQEAGIASLVVSLCALLLRNVMEQRNVKLFITDTAALTAGLVTAILPAILIFAGKNDFTMFLDNMYELPMVMTLGYAGIPFPAFRDFLSHPMQTSPVSYWMIFFYSIMSVYLAVSFLLKSDQRTLYLRVMLLLYCMILMRIPLGRSLGNDIKVFPPTFILLALQMDSLAAAMRCSQKIYMKLGHAIFALIILGTLSVALFSGPSILGHNMEDTVERLIRFPQMHSVKPTGVPVHDIGRGGVLYDPATAKDMIRIKNFLDTYARDDRYVYFFPNEAAYYFVFNKQNPTRYAYAYHAATSAQRRELISDLEKKKPRFIVYSLNTWRVDGIPETVQVPEVVDYIRQKYDTFSDLGGVIILQRKFT